MAGRPMPSQAKMGAGKPASAGKPAFAGKPASPGRSASAGRPASPGNSAFGRSGGAGFHGTSTRSNVLPAPAKSGKAGRLPKRGR